MSLHWQEEAQREGKNELQVLHVQAEKSKEHIRFLFFR